MLLPLLFGVLCGAEWAEGWGLKKAKDRDKDYRLTVETVVTVPRGLCVRVPCSFSYPREINTKVAPVQGHWFRDGADALSGSPVATTNQSRRVHWKDKGRFQLVGSPGDGGCSLLLTDARMEDRGLYFFRVEGGPALRYSFVNNKFFLNVTGMELAGMGWELPLPSPSSPSPPPASLMLGGPWGTGRGAPPEVPALIPAPTPEPAVYVPETLEPGRQATAVCAFKFSSEQCPAPTLSWTGAALSPQEIGVTRGYVSVLTFTPGRQDHDSDLTCRASFSTQGLSSERSVRLNVACESGGGHRGGQQARWVGRWGRGALGGSGWLGGGPQRGRGRVLR